MADIEQVREQALVALGDRFRSAAEVARREAEAPGSANSEDDIASSLYRVAQECERYGSVLSDATVAALIELAGRDLFPPAGFGQL